MEDGYSGGNNKEEKDRASCVVDPGRGDVLLVEPGPYSSDGHAGECA